MIARFFNSAIILLFLSSFLRIQLGDGAVINTTSHVNNSNHVYVNISTWDNSTSETYVERFKQGSVFNKIFYSVTVTSDILESTNAVVETFLNELATNHMLQNSTWFNDEWVELRNALIEQYNKSAGAIVYNQNVNVSAWIFCAVVPKWNTSSYKLSIMFIVAYDEFRVCCGQESLGLGNITRDPEPFRDYVPETFVQQLREMSTNSTHSNHDGDHDDQNTSVIDDDDRFILNPVAAGMEMRYEGFSKNKTNPYGSSVSDLSKLWGMKDIVYTDNETAVIDFGGMTSEEFDSNCPESIDTSLNCNSLCCLSPYYDSDMCSESAMNCATSTT